MRDYSLKIGAAFSLGFFGISKVEEFIQFAYQKELEVVELVAEPPYCFVDDFSKQRRTEISKLAQDLQIELTIHATFSDINMAALNHNVREANNHIVKKSIQFAADINAKMKEAANGALKGILEYTDDAIVSSDIVGNPHSSIFSGIWTKAIGNHISVMSWYDNEWGYSNRLAELIVKKL